MTFFLTASKLASQASQDGLLLLQLVVVVD